MSDPRQHALDAAEHIIKMMQSGEAVDNCLSEGADAMTERAYLLRQDLGWIKLFAEGMNIDNWQDMRLRIIRQVNQAEHSDGEPQTVAKETE